MRLISIEIELSAALSSDVFSVGIVLLQLFNKTLGPILHASNDVSMKALMSTDEQLAERLCSFKSLSFPESEIYFPLIKSMCSHDQFRRKPITSVIDAALSTSHAKLFHETELISAQATFLKDQVLAGISQLATTTDVAVVDGKLSQLEIHLEEFVEGCSEGIEDLLKSTASVQDKCALVEQICSTIEAAVSQQTAAQPVNIQAELSALQACVGNKPDMQLLKSFGAT